MVRITLHCVERADHRQQFGPSVKRASDIVGVVNIEGGLVVVMPLDVFQLCYWQLYNVRREIFFGID
jgi:hypothetical protein